MTEINQNIKIIIIGDENTGKTSIINRYINNKFSDEQSTIGIVFKSKKMKRGGKNINIQFWDTSGQEKYRSLVKTHYKGAHGCILVYDLTNNKSFEDIEWWMKEIDENIEEYTTKVIIGNKMDKDNIQISLNDSNVLKRNDIKYFETSAKIGYGIEEVIEYIIEETEKKIENKEINVIKGEIIKKERKWSFYSYC